MAAASPPELNPREIDRVARALAEPRRVELLRQLGGCPDGSALCSSLSQHQDISAATMSHHLKELEAAGLIRNEREGKFARLTLRREVLAAYLASLSSLLE